MSQAMLPENAPLYLRAKHAILNIIMDSLDCGNLEDKKLPPEEELCQRLGVSRPTVREALMALSREGVITKKHGTGNLVHPSALEPCMRVDIHTDFLAMIEGKGYDAGLRCSAVRAPTAEEADILRCSGGGDAEGRLFQERRYTANGSPAVLCYSYVHAACHKCAALNAVPCAEANVATSPDAESNYARLLGNLSGEELAHAMTRIHPTTADARVADFFQLEEGRPILRLFEGHYSIHDILLAENVAYLNPNTLDLSILRKW